MAKGDNTQTTTNTPWSAAIPYETQALKDAQALQNSGAGFNYFPTSTVTPFSSQTKQALGTMQDLAAGFTDSSGTFHPPAGAQLAHTASTNALSTLQDQGMSDWERAALGKTNQTALGNNNITAADYLALYARGDYLQGRTVTNADGSTTNIPPPSDPAFTRQLDYQAGQTADDINRGFSGAGRYGSATQYNTLGDSIGRMRDTAMADELGKQRQLQLSAAGMLGQQQGQNISNQMGAGQNIANAQNQAYQTVGNVTGQIPGITQALYQPSTMLAQVGSAYEDQAQKTLQDQINRYNSNDMEGWNRLSAANAIYGGAGQLGGTQSTTASKPSWLQGLLGGGALGASVGGLPGALLGGLGGGIGGILGF